MSRWHFDEPFDWFLRIPWLALACSVVALPVVKCSSEERARDLRHRCMASAQCVVFVTDCAKHTDTLTCLYRAEELGFVPAPPEGSE